MTTEEIKDRITEIDELIRPLQTEKHELEMLLLAEKSQFKVGDVIEWAYGVGMAATGRVTAIRHWVCGDPYWVVDRIRKDGKSGRHCKVYIYQNPKKK